MRFLLDFMRISNDFAILPFDFTRNLAIMYLMLKVDFMRYFVRFYELSQIILWGFTYRALNRQMLGKGKFRLAHWHGDFGRFSKQNRAIQLILSKFQYLTICSGFCAQNTLYILHLIKFPHIWDFGRFSKQNRAIQLILSKFQYLTICSNIISL